jgi:hypothetical protein
MPDLSSAITLFPIPKKFIVPPIGQSFDLVGGQPKDTIALHVSANRLEKTPSEAGGSKYFHLKDTNALSDALQFSMSAGGGGWGASYGMTADASALLQTSSLTQTIHFRAVAQKSQAMVTPETALSADAAKLLNEGIEIFTQRYGTHFVAGYVYGKRCNLSYHLNFSTRDLATKFSATFSESTSEFGFSESMKTSITNALTTSHSSCSFGVESDYRGFEPVSPQSITDLAKVVADYDKAAGDTAPILLVICPWTYLDQVSGKFGLPIDDTLANLAILTNKLIMIRQSGQNFIDSGRFAGDSQWKAILNAGRPVQKELDDILALLRKCNTSGQPVTRDAIDGFAPAEPLADQMNTALQRFCLAFSVAAGPDWFPVSAAEELAPQSQALHLNGQVLSTLYNTQFKGVWFDCAGSHNICSHAGAVLGFTVDPAGGTLVGWLAPSSGDYGRVSPALRIQGSTNSRSLDDVGNAAKLYWPVEVQGMPFKVALSPV